MFDKWQNKQKVEPPDSLKNTKIESNKILPEKFCKDGIVDPDIIIWSAINTFYLVESVLGAKKINGKNVLEIKEKVIQVIRMCHASYYQGRIEPLPVYKNKIIGKLMAKLKNELDAIGWTY